MGGSVSFRPVLGVLATKSGQLAFLQQIYRLKC